MNYEALRVKRVGAMMDAIIEDKKKDDDVFNIEKEMLGHRKPNIWNSYVDGNMERILEVDFQKFAISVSEYTRMDLENISTFTFYASVEYLKEKHKPKKQ